jgi:hypothetical protein
VDAVAGDARDFADERAALLAKARVDEALVVDALEPAGVQAATEGHLEFVALVAADVRRRTGRLRVEG